MAIISAQEGALKRAIVPLVVIGLAVFFGYAFALSGVAESAWALCTGRSAIGNETCPDFFRGVA
ncbi:hypothetical protein IU450_37235 [Nocardia abscessus]|uniref:hypothetical protein n=1 Tax=Nocardia abscessus TaxID=120957 RepID=UPI001892EAA5|nr:hypothetical protein [Nocardia abscessus]MBF6341485.1 hypothetical protein [Nocardia abscessus]